MIPTICWNILRLTLLWPIFFTVLKKFTMSLLQGCTDLLAAKNSVDIVLPQLPIGVLLTCSSRAVSELFAIKKLDLAFEFRPLTSRGVADQNPFHHSTDCRRFSVSTPLKPFRYHIPFSRYSSRLQLHDFGSEASDTNYFIWRYDANKICTTHFAMNTWRRKRWNNDKVTRQNFI